MDPNPIEFESTISISPERVQKLARNAIGAYRLVYVPERDVQLALQSLGLADEVVFRKLKDDKLFLSPKPGVTVERFNELLLKAEAGLGRKLNIAAIGMLTLISIGVGAALAWVAMQGPALGGG